MSDYHGKRRRDAARSRAAEENSSSSDQVVYYSPGEKLEGQDGVVNQPEGWDNEGTAFDVGRGKRKSHIEGVWSTEIDGGVIESITPPKKAKFLLWGIVALGLVVALGLGFFTLKNSTSSNEPQPLTNVLASIYPQSQVINKYTVVTLDKASESFKTENTSLSVKGLDPSPPVDSQCSIDKASEICSAGTVLYENRPYEVFYSGDLIHNSNFTTMESFTPITQSEESLTASSIVNFAGRSTQFLLFTNSKNGMGWFVEVPLDLPAKAIAEYSQKFSYTYN